jgi:SGNH domain (fused to AT3 domains)
LVALTLVYPHLVVWDPFPILCPQDPCRAATEAGPLFFDGDHLSSAANRLLYPEFMQVLRQARAAEK